MPNYRTTDPETSRLSADAIDKACLYAKIEKLLKASPGLTGNEIDRVLGPHAHKRLSEMERFGMLRRGKKRNCSVSGRPGHEWYLANLDGNQAEVKR